MSMESTCNERFSKGFRNPSRERGTNEGRSPRHRNSIPRLRFGLPWT